MIIRIDSAAAEAVEAARHSLQDMARGWGCEITAGPGDTAAPGGTPPAGGKAIDPVAAASLVLSIPSAALAVLDLADRIARRRRAAELTDQARRLAATQVTVSLIIQDRPVQISALDPDQLLDLAASHEPAVRPHLSAAPPPPAEPSG